MTTSSSVDRQIGELQGSCTNPFAYLNEMGSGDLSDIIRSESSPSLGSMSSLEVEDATTSSTTANETEEQRTEKILKDFGPAPHKLSHPWSFWYLKPPVGSKSNATNYESLLKCIGNFDTVQDFWAIYLSLKRPINFTQGTTDYSLFRQGIRPVWEDDNNARGGKLMIRLKKDGDIAARYYETLILLVIGGHMACLEEITGIVFSIRPYENILSIWTRNASDSASIQCMRDHIKSYFGLSPTAPMEYKPHHYTKPSETA